MRHLAVALAGLVAVGAASLAPAQDGVPDCKGIWRAFVALAGDNGLQTAPFSSLGIQQDGTRCSAKDLRFETGTVTNIYIDEIGWSGKGFDRFVSTGLPPDSLEVRVRALKIVPQIDDRVMQFIFNRQAQTSGIDIGLRFDWDPTAKRATLHALNIDFPGDNAVSYSAVIDNIDLSSTTAMQMSMGAFTIRSTTTTITTNGLFESYVLPALAAGILNPETDPELQIIELRRQAVAEIADFPTANVSAPSRQALIALVKDLPNPTGTVTVAMQADPGLGPVRFLRLAQDPSIAGISDIWPLLDGVVFEISYEP